MAAPRRCRQGFTRWNQSSALCVLLVEGAGERMHASQAEQFEALVGPYFDHLYRVAYRLTGSSHDAEDLVQTLFLKLYPKTRELQRIDALKPWLVRALYNAFVDQWRRRNGTTTPTAEDPEAELAAVPSDVPEPAYQTDLDLRLEVVAEAVNMLDPKHRSLIVLHDMEGYSLAELKALLNLPTGTLKSRLFRGRAHLRSLLSLEPSAEALRVPVQGDGEASA